MENDDDFGMGVDGAGAARVRAEAETPRLTGYFLCRLWRAASTAVEENDAMRGARKPVC